MAKHHVEVVLIDTVDKAEGWKILRTGNDRKGLLGPRQIARLTALGEKLGIKVLWAGGITISQVYEFGQLGVFGIYVTTAAAETIPVKGKYRRDPGMPSAKQPTFKGVLNVEHCSRPDFSVSVRSGACKIGSSRLDSMKNGCRPSCLQRGGLGGRNRYRRIHLAEKCTE